MRALDAARRPQVLTLSRIYPNPVFPWLGLWVEGLVRQSHALWDSRVVAPRPYCPPLPFLGEEFLRYRRIPERTIKGAVEVLTRYMAKELGPRGIAVNTVAPGAIATDFSGGIVRDNPEVNRQIASFTALGRAGLPDDIGPMIAALLSEENRWVNAQRIEVSGGMLV